MPSRQFAAPAVMTASGTLPAIPLAPACAYFARSLYLSVSVSLNLSLSVSLSVSLSLSLSLSYHCEMKMPCVQ